MSEEKSERQPDDRVREMARELGESKIGLLQKMADAIGMEQMESLYQRTLEIQAAGGMPTGDGQRRRTPGGVLFQLSRELLTPSERRKIFRSDRPKTPPPPPKPKGEVKPPQPALIPPTPEQVKGLLRAAIAVPAAQKGGAVMKITVIGRPKQIKKMDTCVLVVMVPKAPSTLPKGLPALPDVSTATVAVFIASKQWSKVEEALRHDPTDELIVEGFPANDPKNQLTAVWAQSCTTKVLQRAIRAQRSEGIM